MKKLALDAVMENLDAAVDFVVAEAETLGFKPLDLNRIRLACEELVVNIIHYAYPGAKGTLELACGEHPRPKGLRIELVDGGIAFDPLACEPTDTTKLPVEDRSIGGLGIHLVKTVMNELAYRRENGKNILTLVKYLE